MTIPHEMGGACYSHLWEVILLHDTDSFCVAPSPYDVTFLQEVRHALTACA